MKALITRSIVIASLALTANTAMAANATAHKYAAAPHLAVHFVGRSLGAGWPAQYVGLVQNALHARVAGRSTASSDWSPSYDNSPAIVESSAARDAHAASDAESQAIQSMNDTNALSASMAAAQAQNDAANAATLQTEINANNN
jgi:hypothetical protein